MISEFAFGGLTQTYKVKDLIIGYNSTVTERLNAMEPNSNTAPNAGYLVVDPMTTPISNNFNGPTANRVFTLFTG